MRWSRRLRSDCGDTKLQSLLTAVDNFDYEQASRYLELLITGTSTLTAWGPPDHHDLREQPPRVLLVDDAPINLQLLASALGRRV